MALIVLAMAGGATALAMDGEPARPKLPPPSPAPQACTRPAPDSVTISTGTPSRPLLDALGILRRPAQPADRPPDAVARRAFPMDGLMLDAARRIRERTWLLPVENLHRFVPTPADCLAQLPAKQRRSIQRAQEQARARGPVEGVAFVSGDPPQAFPAYPLALIRDGRAFDLDICAGPLHDKLGLRGLVPDGVTNVAVTAKDGTITEAKPDQNTFAVELARPADPDGLPSQIIYTTATGTVRAGIHTVAGYTQPCEPPSKSSNGQRRDPPTKAGHLLVELQTSRWEAEDTGPLVVGATYRTKRGRCLIVGPEKRLPKGYRLCVDDKQLKRQRYIAKAARLPNGDVFMGGFADPEQVAYVLMERSNVVGGARRLVLGKRSGAFLLIHRGPRHAAGSFRVRIALRGRPVRYAATRTITLRAN
jgi:hypothetical protein